MINPQMAAHNGVEGFFLSRNRWGGLAAVQKISCTNSFHFELVLAPVFEFCTILTLCSGV